MTFAKYVNDIIGVLNTIVVPIIITLAFLAFIWGMVNYFFLRGDDVKSREAGKQFILWGILGLTVLFSVWGFVNLLLSTLGIAPSA